MASPLERSKAELEGQGYHVWKVERPASMWAPKAWVGEDFKAKIQTRQYTKKDGTVAKTNDLKEILASDDVAF